MHLEPKRYLNILVKLVLSIALAFPLCGLTSSLIGLIRDPKVFINVPLSDIVWGVLIVSLWDGIGATATGGFPIADEAGINHTNMYPYIVLTACIIFFLLSKGWRWFSKRTAQRN